MSSEDYKLGRGVDKTDIGAASFPAFTDLDLDSNSTKAVTGLDSYEKMFDKPATGEKFEWVDECPVEGMFAIPEMWKRKDIKTQVLDMSKAPDLETYSGILNKSDCMDPTVVVLDEQKQFCQNVENWKVFITTAKVMYKKIIK